MSSLRVAIAQDLAFVFLASWAVRLIWVLLIPPWASPDEPDHFTYVSHLVEQREIPRTDPDLRRLPTYSIEMLESWKRSNLEGISGMGTQSGGYMQSLPVHHDYLAARNQNGAPWQRLSAAGGRASNYSPFYYAYLGVFYRLAFESPLLSRLYAVRAGSALLGAFACCFAYLLAFEVGRKRSWGRAVALAMAFMPMHAFISASVNNDSAMVLCTTALSWLGLRALLQPSITPALACALGGVSGLTLVSKPTGAPIVLVVGAILFWRMLPRTRNISVFVRGNGVVLATFLASFAVIEGAWLAFRASLTSATTTRTTESLILVVAGQDSRHSFWSYLTYLDSLGSEYFHALFVRGYWGQFGWLEVMMPDGAYRAILFVSALGAAGFLARVIRRREERKALLFHAAYVVAHAMVLFVVVDYFLSFAGSGGGVGLQGRYFLASLGSLLVVLTSGLSYLVNDHPALIRMIPASMFALHLVSLSSMLDFYYGMIPQ